MVLPSAIGIKVKLAFNPWDALTLLQFKSTSYGYGKIPLAESASAAKRESSARSQTLVVKGFS